MFGGFNSNMRVVSTWKAGRNIISNCNNLVRNRQRFAILAAVTSPRSFFLNITLYGLSENSSRKGNIITIIHKTLYKSVYSLYSDFIIDDIHDIDIHSFQKKVKKTVESQNSLELK